MDKILSFVVNSDNKLLLLKGSSNDPQFHKSFWYVVTGGCENTDKDFFDTVKREVMEETNLVVNNIIDLDWFFEYVSLGNNCIEHAFISYVDNNLVKLNEESIDFCWCSLDEFIDKVNWFYDKNELRDRLSKYVK